MYAIAEILYMGLRKIGLTLVRLIHVHVHVDISNYLIFQLHQLL